MRRGIGQGDGWAFRQVQTVSKNRGKSVMMMATMARAPVSWNRTRCAAASALEVIFATATGISPHARSRGAFDTSQHAVAIAVIIATARTFQKMACAV